MDLSELSGIQFCYLTTRGRTSGEPREIEIWFGLVGTTLYLMSGGRDRSHWLRNLRQTPAVTVRIGDRTFAGVARLVEPETDEDAAARELLVSKYQPGYSGDLADWRQRALPVAVELHVAEGGGG